MMNDDKPAAFEFTTAGVKTMADDTLRLSIDISPKDAPAAFACFGQRGIRGAIAVLNSAAGTLTSTENSAAGKSSSWVSEMYKHGWWLSLDVLKVLGPEREYAGWVRQQGCANCGQSAPSEYAHVRRAGEAGVGYKPPYRAIALCHVCHHKQHQHGESALSIDCDKALRDHLSEWGHQRLRDIFDVESLTNVSLPRFAQWLQEHELQHTWPGIHELLRSEGYATPILAGGHPGARA